MSSNIYDNDCSIIKKPVTSDEFKTVIDSLRDEIANLKKEIESLKSKNNNDFIIDLVDYNKIDKIVEEEHKEILLYLKSMISSKDFRIGGRFKIPEFAFLNKINDYKNLIKYLSRRNLQIKHNSACMEYHMTLIDETLSIREETKTSLPEQSELVAVNPYNNQPGQTF
jgi:hypothetical protein